MLMYIPSVPSFIRVFIMKGCWISLKAFSAFIEDYMIFVFASVNVINMEYYIDWFSYVESSLHS
jgi:hypothetical protein